MVAKVFWVVSRVLLCGQKLTLILRLIAWNNKYNEIKIYKNK